MLFTKHRRALAVALCVVTVLALFVSSAYLVHEAAHPHCCVGKSCPVCQFIAQIEEVFRGFGLALAALLMLVLAALARRERTAPAVALPVDLVTLVGQKVRLND